MIVALRHRFQIVKLELRAEYVTWLEKKIKIKTNLYIDVISCEPELLSIFYILSEDYIFKSLFSYAKHK